jgi:hypothetical protein
VLEFDQMATPNPKIVDGSLYITPQVFSTINDNNLKPSILQSFTVTIFQ